MVCNLVSIYFDSSQLVIQQKQTVITLDYLTRDMLKLDFIEKGLGIVSLPHFVHDFSRKMLIVLHSIN